MSKVRTTGEKRKAVTGTTLGLCAFEKISAVEGVRLTPEMKRDLQELDQRRLTPAARTRFITDKYGKKSA